MSNRHRLAAIAALVLSGDILAGHKGIDFYYRAKAPKATRKKKARRKMAQASRRRNRK